MATQTGDSNTASGTIMALHKHHRQRQHCQRRGCALQQHHGSTNMASVGMRSSATPPATTTQPAVFIALFQYYRHHTTWRPTVMSRSTQHHRAFNAANGVFVLLQHTIWKLQHGHWPGGPSSPHHRIEQRSLGTTAGSLSPPVRNVCIGAALTVSPVKATHAHSQCYTTVANGRAVYVNADNRSHTFVFAPVQARHPAMDRSSETLLRSTGHVP